MAETHRLAKTLRAALLSGLCLGLGTQTALANCTRDAVVVFDASASMASDGFEDTGHTKFDEARAALARLLPEIAPLRQLGLVSYGPNGADACAGVTTHFAPRPDAAAAILAELDALHPDGLTPLTQAVTRAARALPSGIIVLVTDGNESCGGAPCDLAATLGQSSLTVHVIGFKVVRDFFAWNDPAQRPYFDGEVRAGCLADATGGQVVTAETSAALLAALRETLACPLTGALRTPIAKG